MVNKKLNQLDFTTLTREIVKGLRGDRTQREINDKLGVTFNQMAKWESGEKRLLWKEFLQLCHILGIDMRPVFIAPFRYFGDVEEGGEVILYLSGHKKVADIAREMNISRDKVSRWLNRKQDPEFEDMLCAIRTFIPGLLINFIEFFISLKQVPTLVQEYKGELDFKEYLMKNPVAMVVARYLQMEDYNSQGGHKDGSIAKNIGITIEKEREILTRLLDYKIITFEDGRYKILPGFLQFRIRYEDTLPIRQFYMDRGKSFLTKYNRMPAGCFMSYDSLPLPKENIRQAIDLCFEYYRKITALAGEDQNNGHSMRLFQINLFPAD